jgi:ABC-type antimicrobial peptide transport system permease subunit
MAFVARGSLSSRDLLTRLRDAVRDADPTQAVYNVRMMEDVVNASIALRRTNAFLITLFGAVALLLAALGVYAVVAHEMVQRTREMGIRLALGASGADLVGLLTREVVGVVLFGLVLGLAGSWVLGRMLESQLYGVDPQDAATFALATIVLIGAVGLATVVPSRRVFRLDPVDVIRAE